MPPSQHPAPHPTHIARRAFLRRWTAGTLAAPFLWPGGTARAATAPVIKNLVVVTWPDGLETGWQPTGNETTWQLPARLAPLAPYRDRLTVINGLKGGTGNLILQHSEGTLSLWTGDQPTTLQNYARLPSFEQKVAAKLSVGAPYKSLHFGIQTNRASSIANPYVHYAGADQPIPAEDDPGTTYKLIFGGLSQDAAALDRLRSERRSVLDFVHKRLQALTPRIAAEDRPKLESHAESLRSIERSLDALATNRCATKTSAPTLTAAAAVTDENFPAVVSLQSDLLVAALQCGVTRVATLQLSNTDSQTKIPGLVTKRGVHEAMHSGTTDERIEINGAFLKYLGALLGKLDAVSTGPGTTLLDETLVVMSTEMAVGGHWNDPVPLFLAGCGAGVLKMGRYLNVPGLPRHTKVIASVLRACGAGEGTTFGAFTGSDADGELAELTNP